MPEFPSFDGRFDPSEWPSQPVTPLPFNYEAFASTTGDSADLNPLIGVQSDQQYGTLQRQSSIDSMTAFLPFAAQNEMPIFQQQPAHDPLMNQLTSSADLSYNQPNNQPSYSYNQTNNQHAYNQSSNQSTYSQPSNMAPFHPTNTQMMLVQSHQQHWAPSYQNEPFVPMQPQQNIQSNNRQIIPHIHQSHTNQSVSQSINHSVSSPTISPNSDPSSPSMHTHSSNSSMVAFSPIVETPVIATAVAEDSLMVKKVRHREIDRKRREREQRVMNRLAALVNTEIEHEPTMSGQEKTVARRGAKSKTKPLDRVALLEAACDRLEANKRELEMHYLMQNARLKDMSIKLVCLAADTGHKIDADSIYESVPRLTGLQSMHWMLIQTELEAAYARNETNPNLTLSLPASSLYTFDFRPSKNDPNFSQFMKSLYSLFRGDVPSVQVTFRKPDTENNWIETSTLVWIAPKPRFYGRVDSDRSLTKGRVIVMAGRNMPTPPHNQCTAQEQMMTMPRPQPDHCS